MVHCSEARHPILLLREASATEPTVSAKVSAASSTGRQPRRSGVVGNDLDLSSEASALVISGPNAGGKTLILKVWPSFI